MMKKLAPQSTWSRNDRLCEAARAMNRSIQGRDDEEEVAEEGQLKVLLAIDEAHHLIDHKAQATFRTAPALSVLSKIHHHKDFSVSPIRFSRWRTVTESESHELDLKTSPFVVFKPEITIDLSNGKKVAIGRKAPLILNASTTLPNLVIRLESQTFRRSRKKWLKPYDEEDTRRVHYQFLGLDQIACLSRGMITALTKLINADPEDL
ncbi:hypothetical protein KEM48_002691 [Puccinia striiformis f. sp. tritici PST-130]|nr:hypothetical protein KEM48_002691 [Puccinia striiformis f. sp. tritici PST-130]